MSENFDEKHKELMKDDICHIESIVTKSSIPTEKISEKELKDALSKLKNNKAPDVFDLTSEHFKFAGHTLLNYLLTLLNHMVDKKKVSPVLKEGLLTSIFKKGDKSDPADYRGITVTPVFLKILEHVLNQRHNKVLNKTQSKLQKGFTVGSSSMGAAMILTECINEACNMKKIWKNIRK